jgi:hypothetical protein
MRLVVKRLRAALPHLRIIVGRWALEALADERNDELRGMTRPTSPDAWTALMAVGLPLDGVIVAS